MRYFNYLTWPWPLAVCSRCNFGECHVTAFWPVSSRSWLKLNLKAVSWLVVCCVVVCCVEPWADWSCVVWSRELIGRVSCGGVVRGGTELQSTAGEVDCSPGAAGASYGRAWETKAAVADETRPAAEPHEPAPVSADWRHTPAGRQQACIMAASAASAAASVMTAVCLSVCLSLWVVQPRCS